jgi:hypothetical protein
MTFMTWTMKKRILKINAIKLQPFRRTNKKMKNKIRRANQFQPNHMKNRNIQRALKIYKKVKNLNLHS